MSKDTDNSKALVCHPMTLSDAPACSPFNELQQVQLRAQILVYGALLQGSIPEEPLMVGAFSDTSTDQQESCWNDGRHLWEKSWLTAKARETPNVEPLRNIPEPDVPTPMVTSPLAISVPTARRTPLTEPALDTRKRKKTEIQDDTRQEDINKCIEEVRKCLEDAKSVMASISQQSKSLQALLPMEKYNQVELSSIAIALEATFSAAGAALASVNLAYEAASQATQSAETGQQDGVNGKEVSNALATVFKSVSQARIAMEVGSGRGFQGLRRRQHKTLALDKALLNEGASVEVMSGGYGAWLPAKVLSVKDGIVHVAYSETAYNGVDEVIPVACQPPRIRFPYPSFDLNERHEDPRHHWTVGDHVDVRIQHGWREGIIVFVSKDEVLVFHPGDSSLESAKSSDLRVSLLWDGNKWTPWQCLSVESDDQPEKEKEQADIEIVSERHETGPSPNHKMRKLADVILKESEGQKHRHSKNSNTDSTVTSKIKKAKKLIEKAANHQLMKNLNATSLSPPQHGARQEGQVMQPTAKLLEELRSVIQAAGNGF